jgi:hypothetical protein
MKRLAILLLVLTIFLLMILPAQAATANSPSLSGIQIFPKDHVWNTRVDNMPVDPKSGVYINDLLKDTAPYGFSHYIDSAIPYNVVDSSTPHQYVRFLYAAYSDNVAYPIPANPIFEQGSNDHHMEIIDKDEMVLYELFAAEKLPDGSWKASSGAVWDLKGYKFRKNNVTPMWSTDEAGLAVLPGLVRYEEVSAGSINHALRLAVPQMQNTWVWPARSSAPLPGVYDPSHLPAGQRLRLKASYDISGYPPQAKVILQALKTYGAITATNQGSTGKPVTIIGSPDTRWNYNDLNTLTGVDLSNFEAVDESSLMIDKNSAQARQTSGAPSSPTITVISPNGGETWQRGTSHTITWSYTGSPGSTVNLVLVKAGTDVGTIVSGVSTGSGGTGSYTWPIASSGTTGSDFQIRVQSTSQTTVRDVSTHYFALTSGTSLDNHIQFGIQGDRPVTGDWNGDGKDNIGIFRPSNSIWSLDVNGNNAWDGSDKSLGWGIPGDIPVVGDWNGDGKDDIGIFRPGNGIWSLDANGNNAWDGPGKSISWGVPGDIPVVGDWNGDGKDDIGIFRPGNGVWSLDANGDYAWESSDKSIHWGVPGDIPVVGDWNGDGKDDIGIFRPGNGVWSLDANGDYAWESSDKSLSWGVPGDIPVVGDWNGDGKDNIGIFRPGNSIWSLDANGNNKWDGS